MSRVKVKGNNGIKVIVQSTATGKIITTENDKNLAARIKAVSKRIYNQYEKKWRNDRHLANW